MEEDVGHLPDGVGGTVGGPVLEGRKEVLAALPPKVNTCGPVTAAAASDDGMRVQLHWRGLRLSVSLVPDRALLERLWLYVAG
jgi:hypothetical protein